MNHGRVKLPQFSSTYARVNVGVDEEIALRRRARNRELALKEKELNGRDFIDRLDPSEYAEYMRVRSEMNNRDNWNPRYRSKYEEQEVLSRNLKYQRDKSWREWLASEQGILELRERAEEVAKQRALEAEAVAEAARVVARREHEQAEAARNLINSSDLSRAFLARRAEKEAKKSHSFMKMKPKFGAFH